jgi:hypothetical protein
VPLWIIAPAAFLVISIQIILTLMDTNFWPFCSYDLFSFLPTEARTRLIVAMYEDDHTVQTVSPGNILPLEFFRANHLIADVYFYPGNAKRKIAFAAYILDQLNNAPWIAFDETYAAATPQSGRRFVGFDLLAETTSTFAAKKNEPIPEASVDLLFSYGSE